MLTTSGLAPSIGELSHRVDLQRRTDAPDAATGGTVEAYAKIATVWARVEAISGSLYFASQQVETGTTHAITVRYRSDWRLVEYIRWDRRSFRVERCRDLEGREYQEFLCEEIETET
jgi:SPP1 family predicted phage head-tail adaptor